MATTEGKTAFKVSKNMSGMELLPEAFAVNLHVVKDKDMIRSLGRDKFVQLSIHGSQGWQQGVNTPSHNLSYYFLLACFCFVGHKLAYTPIPLV